MIPASAPDVVAAQRLQRPGVGYRRVVTWPSFGPSRDNLVFDVTDRLRGHDDDD